MRRRINALSDHGRQHQTTKVTFSAMSNTKTPSLHNFQCTIMSNTITIEEQNKIEPQSEQLKRNTSADRERRKRCTTFTMKITVLTAERSGTTAVKDTFWHHNRCCQHQAIPTQSLLNLGHSDGDNLDNFCASRELPRGMHIGAANRPRALIGIPRTPIMHLPYSAKWIFNCPTIWLRHVGRAVSCGTHNEHGGLVTVFFRWFCFRVFGHNLTTTLPHTKRTEKKNTMNHFHG